MSTGNIPLNPATPNQLITSALWDAEFANIQTLTAPEGIEGYSDNDTEMQLQTNPAPGGVLSHATSMAGEFERIRYVIAQMLGKTHWTDPAASGNNLSNIFITGEIKEFAFSPVPSGFLPCDGAAVSRTTFAALFAAIGTVWGVGDGSTTFNVPDKRGRVSIGSGTGSGLTARTLAGTGGEETHVLSTAELAAHNHTINITDPGHVHGITDPTHSHGLRRDISAGTDPHSINVGQGVGNAFPLTNPITDAQATGITVNSGTTGITAASVNTGSGTAHNNMQPYMVSVFGIKT